MYSTACCYEKIILAQSGRHQQSSETIFHEDTNLSYALGTVGFADCLLQPRRAGFGLAHAGTCNEATNSGNGPGSRDKTWTRATCHGRSKSHSVLKRFLESCCLWILLERVNAFS